MKKSIEKSPEIGYNFSVRVVFEYSNYREFLGDFYSSRKGENSFFSYKVFAELCGFKNKSVINNIIKGRINLTASSISRMSRAMGLEGPEREYFENLVRFNQARGVDDKNRFFNNLESVKKQGIKTGPAQQLRKEHYEFYSRLYHSTIRSIIGLYRFKDDYKWLAGMIYPAIKPLQAKKSVQLQERLGLIARDSEGYLHIADKKIEAGAEILSLGVANYHLDAAGLAGRALRSASKKGNTKNFAGQTLGISKKGYESIIREISLFQDKIAEIAEKDEEADTVFQLNFQLFQTSQRDGGKGKK